MATIQVRTDQTLKKHAQKILHDLGLDMSTAINMYLVQITKRGGIPFPILTENGMTEEEEQRILAMAKDAEENGKRYSSAEELFDDILNE